jgi:hypothetical protein
VAVSDAKGQSEKLVYTAATPLDRHVDVPPTWMEFFSQPATIAKLLHCILNEHGHSQFSVGTHEL